MIGNISIILVILICVLIFINYPSKITQESFMDDPIYKQVRYDLVKANDSEIMDKYKICSNYCKNINNSNCELLCNNYAEKKSDNYKYQYLIFGAATDKFVNSAKLFVD